MLVFALLAFVAVASAGNTTCVSNQLDWYTNEVGETPCRTYERLRQICNGSYQVGNFFPDTPGDNCSDQLSECCCSTIAFTLSMLCMSCQQCTDARGPTCIDAGDGAYELYLARALTADNKLVYCDPIQNKTLTEDVQSAVCNRGVKIPNTVYEIQWGTGAWFYTYSRSLMEKNFAARGDAEFDKCPPTSASSSPSQSGPSQTGGSPTSNPSDRPSGSSEPSEGTPVAPIVGGVVGGVVGLAAVGMLVWFLLRRKSMREKQTAEAEKNYVAPTPWSPPSVNAAPLMSHDDMSQARLEAVAGTSTSGHTLSPPPTIIGTASSIAKQQERERELAANAGPSFSSPSDERHMDAGPIPDDLLLARSPSGRLPPSYGGWDRQ